MKIICQRKALQQFRKECRARFPIEHLAALFGARSSEGNVLITDIQPIIHTATIDDIKIHNRHIRSSKMSALRREGEWLGTIHSHCHRVTDPCCWHLSKTDIESALQYGESLCGVVYVSDKGTRSSVHWYIPSPIPEIAYV